MKYDLVIAHRVCPALAKVSVGFADKKTMVEATTSSLAAALEDLRVRLVVILDGCEDYLDIFERAFGHAKNIDLEIVYTDSIGNQKTWEKQLEILSSVNDSEFVYFSEDDYIYTPNAFRAMLDFAKGHDVDFVTPLDHPDRYNGKLVHDAPAVVRISQFCHWRSVDSTCLTFLAKQKVVAASRRIMESYIYSTEEATMWHGLTKFEVFNFSKLLRAAFLYFVLRKKCRFGDIMGLCTWKRQGLKLLTNPRRHLYSPIPTLAVHLANCSLPLGSSHILGGMVSDKDIRKIDEFERAGLKRS